MQTNLLGRLRNTSLPLTGGLLPLFEAVVNSIHGIEELGDLKESGEILVEIVRKTKQAQLDLDDFKKKPGPGALEDIIGFNVTDDGVGFNDENMESFETLDTDHKVRMGGRGVGRLLWLKAFKRVEVESVFGADLSKLMLRKFTFDAAGGVSNKSTPEMTAEASRHTTVYLDEFNARYRENSRKTLQAIAESILEHCLWYFVRPGGAPRITVTDEGETVFLDDLYDEKMHSSAVSDSIQINDVVFDLIHVKLRSNSLSTHAIAYCADKRLVTEEKLVGKIPGLHGRISDGAG